MNDLNNSINMPESKNDLAMDEEIKNKRNSKEFIINILPYI